MPAFTGNLGTLAGVYRTPASHVDVTAVFTHTQPVRPYRGNGRPEAGYIIERMVDLAADQLGIDPAELRRRNTIPSSAMPYKTSVTFTYDCGEFEKNMDMALDAADKRGFEARRAAFAQARQAARFRLLQHHRALGRRRPRRRRDQVRPHRLGVDLLRQHQPGPGPRDRVQADRLRPPRPRSQRSHLYPGRHRPGVLRRRHRRLALGGVLGLGLHHGGGESRSQGQGDCRPYAQGRLSPTSSSPTACSPARRPTRR